MTSEVEGSATVVRDDAFDGNPQAELLVRQVRLEADAVISIELVDRDGAPLPAWEPGAHLDLFLPSGLIRQYSLCGSAADRHVYRVAVLREPDGRGGSEEVHNDVRVGGSIVVSRPKNQFRIPAASGYLCVAGGVGITPILAIVESAHDRGVPVRLVYGGRTERSMAFTAELATLVPESGLDLVPQDERGVIDLRREVEALPPGWVVCACGPAVMLTALEQVCDDLGVRDRLVVERFTPPDADPGAPAPTNRAVTVELARSGVTIEVASDQSILAAVNEITAVISSCTEGYCGTCETRVLKGIPDHRDTVLSDEERESNEIMMICVSRAESDALTLDL